MGEPVMKSFARIGCHRSGYIERMQNVAQPELKMKKINRDKDFVLKRSE